MKFFRKTISLILALAFLVSGMVISASAVSYPCEAFVNGTDVNVRSGAGTNYNIVGVANYRQIVTLNGEETGSDNRVWYSVTLGSGVNGYIRSDLIKSKLQRVEFNFNGETTTPTTMYDSPGTWNNKVVSVPANISAVIYAKDYDYDGDMWYYATVMINGNEYTGYLYSGRVELKANYVENADFEAHLTEQGFPESYKEKLRSVYALHPNWIFLADHIDLTWQEALDLQTPVGKSLVNHALAESWRSMRPGAYDWNTGNYISYDSGYWYTAHEDVVAYYLDPRNFLNARSIFQFVGLSFDESVHTKEALERMLEGSFMDGEFPEKSSGYSTWADILYEACKTHSLSPYAFASMIFAEQGFDGVGKLISGTVSGYEGYYNFLSIDAYRTDDKNAVQNGLEYAKASGNYSRPWDNRVDALFGAAEFYTHEYVKNGQDTLYYKKFNVTSPPFGGHQYMTNVVAAQTEGVETSESYKLVENSELVFNIPVYKDMPKESKPYPTNEGNNNYYLSSLAIDGHYISPTFNPYVNTYELVVDGSVASVTVTATTSDGGASVSGNGTHWLNEGKNTIEITVTSTSNRTNTYSIIVYRQGSGAQADVTFNRNAYKIEGSFLSGVSAATTASVLKANLDVKNGSASVIGSSGVENTSVICTGDVVYIKRNDGSNFASYSIAVKGDVSGDGKISLVDLAKIQRHLLLIEEIEGINALAADVSGDGKISLVDLAKVQRHLLLIESIN